MNGRRMDSTVTLAQVGLLVLVVGLVLVTMAAGSVALPVGEGDEDRLGDSDIVLAPASEYAVINETTGELEVRLDGSAPGIGGDGVNVGHTRIDDLVIARNDGDDPSVLQFDHDAAGTVSFGVEQRGDIEDGIEIAPDHQVVIGVWIDAGEVETGTTLLETVDIVVDPGEDTAPEEDISEGSVSGWEPDLHLVDLEMTETATVGDTVEIHATVENRGTDPGVGDVAFEFEGEHVTTETLVVGAADRETAEIRLDLSRTDPGSYNVTADLYGQTRVAPLTVDAPSNDQPGAAPPAAAVETEETETYVAPSTEMVDGNEFPLLPFTAIGIGLMGLAVLFLQL